MDTLHRRSFLISGCAASLVSLAPDARADTVRGHKLVIIILRGALDGLAALPPLSDSDLEALRAPLIDEKATPLSDGFALHSAMPGLAAMYQAGQAAFVPAVAGPYRERSHFEAQDLLESGQVARVSADGWLNRALVRAPAAYAAVSIGPSTPLILRGRPVSATSWSPAALPAPSEDTLQRLLDLYEGDAALRSSLDAALKAEMIADGMASGASGMGGGGRAGLAQYRVQLEAAGRFLAVSGGPEIAVVGLEGWDTHTGQNQMLQQRLTALDNGLGALRTQLGEVWDRTVVVAVSEFGRTVGVNGGGGTDHGTGGLAMLTGGALKGGRMFGDWPGLKPTALFENRDLMPAVDVRSLFKGLLGDHLGWSRTDLDSHVFEDSHAARPLSGLV